MVVHWGGRPSARSARLVLKSAPSDEMEREVVLRHGVGDGLTTMHVARHMECNSKKRRYEEHVRSYDSPERASTQGNPIDGESPGGHRPEPEPPASVRLKAKKAASPPLTLIERKKPQSKKEAKKAPVKKKKKPNVPQRWPSISLGSSSSVPSPCTTRTTAKARKVEARIAALPIPPPPPSPKHLRTHRKRMRSPDSPRPRPPLHPLVAEALHVERSMLDLVDPKDRTESLERRIGDSADSIVLGRHGYLKEYIACPPPLTSIKASPFVLQSIPKAQLREINARNRSSTPKPPPVKACDAKRFQ